MSPPQKFYSIVYHLIGNGGKTTLGAQNSNFSMLHEKHGRKCSTVNLENQTFESP